MINEHLKLQAKNIINSEEKAITDATKLTNEAIGTLRKIRKINLEFDLYIRCAIDDLTTSITTAELLKMKIANGETIHSIESILKPVKYENN